MIQFTHCYSFGRKVFLNWRGYSKISKIILNTTEYWMTDYKAKLDRLDTGWLIDVVKNYRQYGYDDNLRATAITILNKRGITKNDLKITGNFENKTYDHAHDLFKSFGKNSTIAFVLYAILLLTNIMIEILFSYFEPAILLVMLLNWAFLIGYLTFLVISFLN